MNLQMSHVQVFFGSLHTSHFLLLIDVPPANFEGFGFGIGGGGFRFRLLATGSGPFDDIVVDDARASLGSILSKLLRY